MKNEGSDDELKDMAEPLRVNGLAQANRKKGSLKGSLDLWVE